MAADMGQVPVVRQVDHLHPAAQLSGVIGQHPGKEELLVVAVGGEEHQVRPVFHGLLPALHPVRHLAGGEEVQIRDSHLPRFKPEGQGLGAAAEQSLQVQIVVEYPGGIHGHRRAGFVVGYGIFTVFLIEEQIGAPQTFGGGDGERAAVRCRYADGPELLIQNRPGIRKAGALGAGAFFRHIPGLLGPGQHRQGQQKAEQEEGVDQLFQRNHRLNYFCIDYSPDSIKSKQAFFPQPSPTGKSFPFGGAGSR